MRHWTDPIMADVNRQLREYQAARTADPSAFGSRDGCWDNTPDHGPMPLICWEREEPGTRWWILWGVHKHRWPFDYIYCFGNASDSRGELTDPLLTLDVRDLPKKYIGRFRLDPRRCNRGNHRTIIARALADGFDLHANTRDQHERARRDAAERDAQRRADLEKPLRFGDDGLLHPDEVPF